MTKNEKIRLILRQLNGEANKKEKEAFSQWLLAKAENLDLYAWIKKLWEMPMNRQLNFDMAKAEARINKIIHKKEKKIRLWKHGQKIAAFLILLITIGTFVYHRSGEKPITGNETAISNRITKTSEPGEQLRVTLPDGSIVLLNAGSSIQFPEKFEGKSRQVILSGEAFFKVTKDAEHPFMVESNRITTTVLGTSFNIKAFKQGNVTVTVATGKVKVGSRSDDQAAELLLLPNEQATYDKHEKQFRKAEVFAQNYYAWTEGTIRFNNDSLEEVIKILERWYNIHIRLEGTGNEKIRVNGSYKDKKLYSILDGLSYIYGLNYRYENGQTIVISIKTNN
ncbi:MAG: FecR family protein [Mangrovibacterium sp.]